MQIKHKQTGRTIFIKLQNNLSGYRERVYLAAGIAEINDMFGYHRVVSARYDPHLDEWFTNVGDFKVKLEANDSCDQLKNHGFIFTDAKEKEE